jgi:adenine phosphoribosyltransferase
MTDFHQYVRPGTNRAEVSPLLLDPSAFTEAITKMTEPFRSAGITKVVALDAMGFVFGARVAAELNVGLVLFRKGNKVQIDKKTIDFVDYTKTQKTFEVMTEAITPGDRILIVDEWSETGSQLKAAIALIAECGGVTVGASCFNIDEPVRRDPELATYQLYSLL